MADPFIQSHIAEVLRSLRTQWILDIIRPYTRIEIGYLARVSSACYFSVEYWLKRERRSATVHSNGGC